MKLLVSLLAIAVLNLVPFTSVSAQTPSALASLRLSAESLYQAPIPAPSEATLYNNRAVTPASLTGEELFEYLHAATEPAPRRAPTSYSASKSFMYSKADNIGCNGKPGIITFYSQICANGSSSDGNSYKEQGDQNGDGVVDKFVNAEHLWPQSFFGKALPMVADLHHLQSTFVTPNGRRSNLRFCKVSKAKYSTSSGSKLGDNCFEPADAVKGNVARALLYFVNRYSNNNIRQGGMNYDEFWTKNVPMFLEWNKMDPPDANEKRRNDLIEEYQGNRNPFVDDYTLADRIGVQAFQAH